MAYPVNPFAVVQCTGMYPNALASSNLYNFSDVRKMFTPSLYNPKPRLYKNCPKCCLLQYLSVNLLTNHAISILYHYGLI